MQIEVTKHGTRIIEKHNEDLVLIDVFDAVIGQLAGIDVDFTKEDGAKYELTSVRLLRSGGIGMKYGIRVTVERKGTDTST